MKVPVASLFFFLLCFPVFAFQADLQKTENSNVSVKQVRYDDGVLAWEHFFNQKRELDSSKTYYKSGELDELFYYDKGAPNGICFKFNRFGDTITTWQFKRGKLIERNDYILIFTKKNEEKVREGMKRLTLLNKKVKQNPVDIKSIFNRSGVRVFFGNKTLALSDLEKVKKRFDNLSDPNKVPDKVWGGLYDNLGSIYSSFEMEDEALKYRFMALRASPEESRLYYNLGQYLISLKRYKEGIKLLEKAIEMVPSHSFAHWALSIAYTDMGEYEEAMRCVKIAFENEKSIYKRGDGKAERDLNTIRGYLYHVLGDTEAGKADLEEALSINPDNSFALKNLGILYLDAKNDGKACELFRKAKMLKYDKVHDMEDLEPLLDRACMQ